MPLAKLASIDEVRRGGLFKYVRMADDTFRFAAYGTWTPEHRDMIDRSEIAKAGGGVRTETGGAEVIMRGSMSLNLPTLEDDEHLIAILVNGPER